jgi:ankyrin repeat protein
VCGATWRRGVGALAGRTPGDVMARALLAQAPWLLEARARAREGFQKHARGTTQLMRAANCGDARSCRQLAAAGANVDAADTSARWTALHWGAVNGHVAACAALLEAGAGADARSALGWTPLMVAAANANPAIARLLLAGGASAALADSTGRTALHHAAGAGALEVVAMLAAPGAALLAVRDNNGRTPLTSAEEGSHAGCAELLKKRGGRR